MLELLHQIWPALLGALVAAALVWVTIRGARQRPATPTADDSEAEERST